MRSRVVEARVPLHRRYFVVVVSVPIVVTLLLLATAAPAIAQAEWNIGPFLDYSSIHGGHPAAAGLETGVLVGPVGLRVSGFSALDQPYTSPGTSTTAAGARWGGDADLMFIFDFASRGSGGGGIAPYVFAGAGLGVHNQPASFYNTSYNTSQVEGGWSYGGGILLPIGSTLEAMGEVRARPSGFFNATPSTRPTVTQFRVGLSLRLGTMFNGR